MLNYRFFVQFTLFDDPTHCTAFRMNDYLPFEATFWNPDGFFIERGFLSPAVCLQEKSFFVIQVEYLGSDKFVL